MYFVYFVTKTCRIVLGMLILLVFLQQFLMLVGKRPGMWEQTIIKCTRPFWLLADCFCKMTGIPVDHGGIEMRYPVAVAVIALAWLALAVET